MAYWHWSKCDSTLVSTYFSLPYAEKLENLIEYLLNFTLQVQMNTQCLTKNLNKFKGIKTCNIPMVRYFTYNGKFCVRTEWMIPEYFSKAGTMWHERRIILKGRKSTCSPGGKGSNTCFLSWHPPPPWKTKRYSTQKSCMQVPQWLRNCTIDKTIHSSLMQSTFQAPYIFSLTIHRTRLREIN